MGGAALRQRGGKIKAPDLPSIFKRLPDISVFKRATTPDIVKPVNPIQPTTRKIPVSARAKDIEISRTAETSRVEDVAQKQRATEAAIKDRTIRLETIRGDTRRAITESFRSPEVQAKFQQASQIQAVRSIGRPAAANATRRITSLTDPAAKLKRKEAIQDATRKATLTYNQIVTAKVQEAQASLQRQSAVEVKRLEIQIQKLRLARLTRTNTATQRTQLITIQEGSKTQGRTITKLDVLEPQRVIARDALKSTNTEIQPILKASEPERAAIAREEANRTALQTVLTTRTTTRNGVNDSATNAGGRLPGLDSILKTLRASLSLKRAALDTAKGVKPPGSSKIDTIDVESTHAKQMAADAKAATNAFEIQKATSMIEGNQIKLDAAKEGEAIGSTDVNTLRQARANLDSAKAEAIASLQSGTQRSLSTARANEAAGLASLRAREGDQTAARNALDGLTLDIRTNRGNQSRVSNLIESQRPVESSQKSVSNDAAASMEVLDRSRGTQGEPLRTAEADAISALDSAEAVRPVRDPAYEPTQARLNTLRTVDRPTTTQNQSKANLARTDADTLLNATPLGLRAQLASVFAKIKSLLSSKNDLQGVSSLKQAAKADAIRQRDADTQKADAAKARGDTSKGIYRDVALSQGTGRYIQTRRAELLDVDTQKTPEILLGRDFRIPAFDTRIGTVRSTADLTLRLKAADQAAAINAAKNVPGQQANAGAVRDATADDINRVGDQKTNTIQDSDIQKQAQKAVDDLLADFKKKKANLKRDAGNAGIRTPTLFEYLSALNAEKAGKQAALAKAKTEIPRLETPPLSTTIDPEVPARESRKAGGKGAGATRDAGNANARILDAQNRAGAAKTGETIAGTRVDTLKGERPTATPTDFIAAQQRSKQKAITDLESANLSRTDRGRVALDAKRAYEGASKRAGAAEVSTNGFRTPLAAAKTAEGAALNRAGDANLTQAALDGQRPTELDAADGAGKDAATALSDAEAYRPVRDPAYADAKGRLSTIQIDTPKQNTAQDAAARAADGLLTELDGIRTEGGRVGGVIKGLDADIASDNGKLSSLFGKRKQAVDLQDTHRLDANIRARQGDVARGRFRQAALRIGEVGGIRDARVRLVDIVKGAEGDTTKLGLAARLNLTDNVLGPHRKIIEGELAKDANDQAGALKQGGTVVKDSTDAKNKLNETAKSIDATNKNIDTTKNEIDSEQKLADDERKAQERYEKAREDLVKKILDAEDALDISKADLTTKQDALAKKRAELDAALKRQKEIDDQIKALESGIDASNLDADAQRRASEEAGRRARAEAIKAELRGIELEQKRLEAQRAKDQETASDIRVKEITDQKKRQKTIYKGDLDRFQKLYEAKLREAEAARSKADSTAARDTADAAVQKWKGKLEDIDARKKGLAPDLEAARRLEFSRRGKSDAADATLRDLDAKRKALEAELNRIDGESKAIKDGASEPVRAPKPDPVARDLDTLKQQKAAADAEVRRLKNEVADAEGPVKLAEQTVRNNQKIIDDLRRQLDDLDRRRRAELDEFNRRREKLALDAELKRMKQGLIARLAALLARLLLSLLAGILAGVLGGLIRNITTTTTTTTKPSDSYKRGYRRGTIEGLRDGTKNGEDDILLIFGITRDDILDENVLLKKLRALTVELKAQLAKLEQEIRGISQYEFCAALKENLEAEAQGITLAEVNSSCVPILAAPRPVVQTGGDGDANASDDEPPPFELQKGGQVNPWDITSFFTTMSTVHTPDPVAIAETYRPSGPNPFVVAAYEGILPSGDLPPDTGPVDEDYMKGYVDAYYPYSAQGFLLGKQRMIDALRLSDAGITLLYILEETQRLQQQNAYYLYILKKMKEADSFQAGGGTPPLPRLPRSKSKRFTKQAQSLLNRKAAKTIY